MTDLRKAAEQALEALEAAIKAGDWVVDGACDPDMALVALRQALAQPVDAVNMSQKRVDETAKGEHEPVAYVTIEDFPKQVGVPSIKWFKKPTQGPLYTAPPKRKWVGLTDDDFNVKQVGEFDVVKFARYIEAILKERNCGTS